MNWLFEHLTAVRNAWTQIRGAPGSFLLNMLVVAITLTLPFAGLTAIDNLRPISSQFTVNPEISIFLAPSTSREQALALEGDIRSAVHALDASASLAFVPRERALSALKDRTGLSEALGMLDVNPLPDAYVVTIAQFDSAAQVTGAERLAERLGRLEGVDSAQIDGNWVKRMTALLAIARLVLAILAATLALVAVTVVFNTIRLQVLTQRAEIGVAKLVGATDAFVRRPFHYAGALIGLGAGLIATAAVAVWVRPMNSAVAEFAQLYASEFQLRLPSPALIALLLLGCAALGWIGAALATRRHVTQ